MTMQTHDTTRLPKWAQDYIATLLSGYDVADLSARTEGHHG